jgi:pimeloyl-ACP methyl ester carboxylesterase
LAIAGRSRGESVNEPRHHEYLGLGMAGFHRLHYCEWGRRANKRVVICAHGYSGNARDFDFIATALADDYRVICPDIAGRGQSDWLEAPLGYNFGQFLSDLNALLARVGASQVDWVGTSMGGILGMLLAAQPHSPIARLVMNDVGAFLPSKALREIGNNLVAPEHFDSRAAIEDHLRHSHRDWGNLSDAQWQHLAQHGARPDGDGFRLHYDPRIAQLGSQWTPGPGLFFWDVWERIKCPALLLRGERSGVFPATVAEQMLERHAGAQLVELPDCGHAPALMSRGQIAIVKAFLDEDRPASRAPDSVYRRLSGIEAGAD